MAYTLPAAAEPIPGSSFPGPFPVGAYANRLKAQLQDFARVQLVGEICGVRASRTKVYFELRDAGGALPCSIWSTDYAALGVELVDGMRVVLGGGCDYYPGSASSSPSFGFAVTELRPAGEGDLLLQLERLRRRLAADGLFEPQKRLPRPVLPRTIGVVTGETGKARDDVLAALRRRGWGGRLVWAFAPVQDRHAAPRIGEALRGLAAIEAIEVVIVARGGGSLADLFAFCDETLCRTVALLRVPVISSVGHHTDRTLIDDVAAVACSTPTHAAEVAVPLDIAAAGRALSTHARQLRRQGQSAVLGRARMLATLSRAPSEHVARHRRALYQLTRELRAAARRTYGAGRRRAAAAGARAPRTGAGRPRPAADAGPRLRDRHRPRRPAARRRARGPRRRRARSPVRRRQRARARRRSGAMTAPEQPPLSYEAAVARVEGIVRRLDSGDAGLRETLELVREGRGLVEYCAAELDSVSQGLEELRLDELVARLDRDVPQRDNQPPSSPDPGTDATVQE